MQNPRDVEAARGFAMNTLVVPTGIDPVTLRFSVGCGGVAGAR